MEKLKCSKEMLAQPHGDASDLVYILSYMYVITVFCKVMYDFIKYNAECFCLVDSGLLVD